MLEKPFLYLIFGENKALLEDTGVAADDKHVNSDRPRDHGPDGEVGYEEEARPSFARRDSFFNQMSGVEFIAAAPPDIQKAAGIATWPRIPARSIWATGS